MKAMLTVLVVVFLIGCASTYVPPNASNTNIIFKMAPGSSNQTYSISDSESCGFAEGYGLAANMINSLSMFGKEGKDKVVNVIPGKKIYISSRYRLLRPTHEEKCSNYVNFTPLSGGSYIVQQIPGAFVPGASVCDGTIRVLNKSTHDDAKEVSYHKAPVNCSGSSTARSASSLVLDGSGKLPVNFIADEIPAVIGKAAEIKLKYEWRNWSKSEFEAKQNAAGEIEYYYTIGKFAGRHSFGRKVKFEIKEEGDFNFRISSALDNEGSYGIGKGRVLVNFSCAYKGLDGIKHKGTIGSMSINTTFKAPYD